MLHIWSHNTTEHQTRDMFRNKGILEDRQKAGQSTNRELSQKTPSVYQYDEIYYKMEREKIETKRCQEGAGIGSGCKKPKYIGKLLATAVKRKRETERRIERQGQKEREEEGEQFKDKRSFVTSAYKQKPQEPRERIN
ncbi:hypothetical protein NQ317_018289 [Molorchus minor]|uniref:Nuclear speckle splicing regulatory protein 1 N-terminal domain-containing protein n=1 Tax=Molorchus minor TaxID=1323400 RepID=A0ABQ9K535_9CUCU|nr:hypothetical protein NQ317_018289 [Molorchus minor]